MILWMIQTEEAWLKLQATGMLRASRENIMEGSWILPYEWMVDQMKIHIGPPPGSSCFPMWAWYQWEGEKRRKPDLRAGSHLSKGQKGVRIEFECGDETVLLSDFDLWHYVLNYWYLPESESDAEDFEAELATMGLSFFNQKPLPDAKYHNRIVQSWDRIFDLYCFEDDLTEPFPSKSIQATLWELTVDQVKNCKHFRSR